VRPISSKEISTVNTSRKRSCRVSSKEKKLTEPKDEVIISTSPSKFTTDKKAPEITTEEKATHKKTSKFVSEKKSSSSVPAFLEDEGSGISSTPDYGNSTRGVGGPDDVDDDGVCPGGGRRDNLDNPDSVIDNGTCGYSSGGSDYSYSGPDGSYSYDEFH